MMMMMTPTMINRWFATTILILLSLILSSSAFVPTSRRVSTLLKSAVDSSSDHTSPLRPSSALPNRRNKKTPKKHKKSKSIVTQQDLADHVARLYIHGPGGILRDKEKKRDEHENANYLKKLDQHPALVLNADYQPMSYLPLSMWHWQEAVKAVFSGKVTVVDVYENVPIRAAHLEIPLPSVIALNEYVPHFHQTPAFTKRNVFLRDEYRCQYCSQFFHTRELSLDHVVPRCMGGRLHWENAVTCCQRCNGRKGRLSVKDLRSIGMKLLREPRAPTQYELAAVAGRMLPQRVHPTWEPYLGMTSSTTEDGAAAAKQAQQNLKKEVLDEA